MAIRIWLGAVPAIAAAASLGLIAWAGPMVPEKATLPDEVRCLSGLKTLGTDVDLKSSEPLPELTSDTLSILLRELLTDARFETEGADATPRVMLRVDIQSDADLPGGVAIAVVLELYERVVLQRLESQMTLPVFTIVLSRAAPTRDVEARVDRYVREAVRQFLRGVELARGAGG